MQREKDIEDYICEHQESIINLLKSIHGEDEDIRFVGRQVRLGSDNIIDLLYKFDDADLGTPVGDIRYKNFVVVELKNRDLVADDFAQIARYTTILKERLEQEEYKEKEYIVNVYGLLLGSGFSTDALCLLGNEVITDNIYCASFKVELTFEAQPRTIWKEEYLKALALDDRLTATIKETSDGQPSEAK